MKIFLAADHRGFQLKETLKPWLESLGHQVEDCGNTILEPQDDYVDFTRAAANKLAQEIKDSDYHSTPTLSATAIGICGSGIGVSIAANRIPSIRCALCINEKHAHHARKNDHANMLALASEYLTEEDTKTIISTFLSTEESQEEKYMRRCKKLDAIQENFAGEDSIPADTLH